MDLGSGFPAISRAGNSLSPVAAILSCTHCRLLLRLKPENFLESTRSLIFGKYAKKWLAGEINRLRDFLVKHVSKEDAALQTMHDGGVPVHGVSGLIDDKLWATLKKEFFGDEG